MGPVSIILLQERSNVFEKKVAGWARIRNKEMRGRALIGGNQAEYVDRKASQRFDHVERMEKIGRGKLRSNR